MIWKPKEKELTLEEAVNLATKELAPYWFDCRPQVAGVKVDGKTSVFPLDPEFSKNTWLLFFIDFTDFSGTSAVTYAKEWYKRYHVHQLKILLILPKSYSFLDNREPIQKIIESYQLNFPVAVDIDGTLRAAFEAKVLPKVSLLEQSKTWFSFSGPDWVRNTEANIQSFLRSKDPGLPLLPFFQPTQGILMDVLRLEFGSQSKLGQEVEFSSPGTLQQEGDIKVGTFFGVRPKTLEPGILAIAGRWTQDFEKMTTSDSSAVIGFRSPGASVLLIAQSLSRTPDLSIISVEVENLPAYDAICGDDLEKDEAGQSVLIVSKPEVYQLLVRLPDDLREVTLRFPNADKAPVAIYGLRFGSSGNPNL